MNLRSGDIVIPSSKRSASTRRRPFRSAARSALRQPPLSKTGTWLPIGQQLWLEHLSDEKFPPLQAPKSYNLSEILEQVKRRAISRLRHIVPRPRRPSLSAHGAVSPSYFLYHRPSYGSPRARQLKYLAAAALTAAAALRVAGARHRGVSRGFRPPGDGSVDDLGQRTGGPRVSLRPTSPRTDPPCSNRGRRRFSSFQRVWVSNGSLHDNNFQPPLFATDKTSDESARVPHGGHGPVTFRWRGTRPRSESMT
jgi:hypothetical protein